MNIPREKNGVLFMDRGSIDSHGYKLESQLREAYGKVLYTQTCHDKIFHRYVYYDSIIRVLQIILSACTTCGLITVLITNNSIITIIGTIISVILLILNSLAKNFKFIEAAQEHKEASDLLWKIREEYVSILTDFDYLDENSIMLKRDDLQERTSTVYRKYPRTDEKSYKDTQKALKIDGEQTFTDNEIDCLLPVSLRRQNLSTR